MYRNGQVTLGDLLTKAPVERAGDRPLAVLSMTRAKGLIPQTEVFNKVVASRDLSKYKIVCPNQLVVGIHIDEGALGFSGPKQTGIVSPAYTLWNLQNPDRVYTPYLDSFIRSKQAISYFISKYRQTAERRGKITQEQFLSLSIPLPPLAEQKRIAGILDAADALRKQRREALAQLDTLLQSTFLDMFGDPVTNPMGWEVNSIGELGEVITGNTPSRKCPEYYGNAIEWIKSDNINDPSFVLTKAQEGLSEQGTKVGRIAPSGSILVTCIAGSRSCIGNSAIADRDVAFNQQINAFVPSTKVSLWFIFGVFHVGKRLIQRASTNSMKGMVNKSAFSSILVPLPPLDLQQRFAAIVETIEQQKARMRTHLDELDTLFASLQSRAFNGEL
jgi:type I restriction enzyme S subunit